MGLVRGASFGPSVTLRMQLKGCFELRFRASSLQFGQRISVGKSDRAPHCNQNKIMNKFFVRRKQCPVCKNDQTDELCRVLYTEDPIRSFLVSFYEPQGGVEFEYLEDQEYILHECERCGLVFQREIPNDFLMRKLYEEWIHPEKCFEKHERNRPVSYFEALSREVSRVIRMLDRPPRALKFLDYSMGWGNWCRVAQGFGCEVHGTEFSKPRIDYAMENGVQAISREEADKNKYDFINTEQVFEHLPDPHETLQWLVGRLAPRGILKISVPNGWDIKRRIQKWDWKAPKGAPDSLGVVCPMEHINCFNHFTLLSMASKCGLVCVDRPDQLESRRRLASLKVRLKNSPLVRLVLRERRRSVPETYMFFELTGDQAGGCERIELAGYRVDRD